MLHGQYFSILGDSISTLTGYIPEGNASFYGWHNRETGILRPEQTWWGKVLAHFDARLLVNESWSGSLVSCRPGCEIPSYGCSDARTGNLSRDGRMPDHILVFIGANDKGSGVPLYSEDQNDLSVAANAYGAMLDKLRANYPQAQIWCLTLLKTPETTFWGTELLEAYSEMIRSSAKQRGCRCIDLLARQGVCVTVDGLHPSQEGMDMIAGVVIRAMEETE